MSDSTELATQDPTAVPDLVRPARGGGLSTRHVTLPRLYKGETQSNAFKAGTVKAGTIYVANGADDPEPQVIANKPFTDESEGETVRVHILQVKLGLSLNEPGKPLQTWEYNDPKAPLEARDTFDYTIALPEVEDGAEIPVKVLLSSTSTQTAKRANFVLLRLDDETRWPEIAWDMSIKKRTKTEAGSTQVWYVWQLKQVDADPAHVEIATDLANMLGGPGDITPPAPPVAEPQRQGPQI